MFKLKFKTDNAAFEGARCDRVNEVIRILNKVIQDLEQDDLEGNVRDINGNTVGEYSLT